MPKGYTCYCCGASGEEAFTNTRADLLEEVDDDYFDYEKPLDFVTAAERKKLMKQAGGDEAKANDLLTKGDGAQEGGDASTDAGADGEAPKKKKKKKKKNKKKKTNKDDGEVKSDASGSGSGGGDAAKSTKSESSGEDDLDVLGMD